MNPLYAFISNNRLFASVDGKGIPVIKANPIATLVQRLLRQTIDVTVSGEPVSVDRKSAEAFFQRNAVRYKEIIRPEMSLEEKIRAVCALLRKEQKEGVGLPRGLFPKGESEPLLEGSYSEYRELLNELQANGFSCNGLREALATRKNERIIHFPRDDFVNTLLHENWDRPEDLSWSRGRVEVNCLARELIQKIRER